MSERLDAIEEKLAHLERALNELSDVVARQHVERPGAVEVEPADQGGERAPADPDGLRRGEHAGAVVRVQPEVPRRIPGEHVLVAVPVEVARREQRRDLSEAGPRRDARDESS